MARFIHPQILLHCYQTMVNKLVLRHIITSAFIVFSVFICSHHPVFSIDAPSITPLSPIVQSKLYFNDDTGFRDVEITPWSLENHRLGGNFLYLVTSYNTHLCAFPDNMFVLSTLTKISDCKLRITPSITPTTSDTVSNNPLWSRDYYGAFSGHLISTKNSDWQLYTINHGELLNNNYFPSQPCRVAPDIGYGELPCIPANHEHSYNAFVGMSSFPWNLASFSSSNLFDDLGPIVWPANGYVANGQKATFLGILHPSSIIKDNFIYVFFRDTSYGDIVSGRGAGLKVARAPISDDGIDPHSFKTYYSGGFTDSALPTGFTKSNIASYFSQKGGRSSPLFNASNSLTSPDVYSFSVAKLSGTSFYLGLAQDLNLGLTLRLSTDLVNWSQEIVVPGTEFSYFKDGGTATFIKEPFMYPRLANASGDSNVEIDPNDFYITGASTHQNPFNPSVNARVVNQIHLKLTSLPPLAKPGDLNGDGLVNVFDYVKMLSGYNSIYFAADFAALLANYGK